ncbi:MAG: MFS transporter [Candidatus Pacebacteria bacterium]|nr:MFS transporter [Candidatus Paceibacterota bacterium]
MQTAVRDKHINSLPSIFVSFLLLSFHAILVIYINSTFLEQFIPASRVGLIFAAGSLLSIAILFIAPWLIKKIGMYYLTIAMLLLEFFFVGTLAFTKVTTIILVFFILYRGVVASLFYFFDLFLESASKVESKTGRIRGLYLALANTVVIISPTLAGLLLGENHFERVYIVSALFVIPVLLIVIRNFKNESANIESPLGVLKAVPHFVRNKNLRGVLFARTLLQFFYAWMVVYTPVYLYQHMGFDWKEIGFMFTIMLMPFALFQFPAGYLADKKYGEKEILIFGFIVMSLATIGFSLVDIPNFLLITIILFLTRVGASLVEIMTESYFFKKVDEDNSNIISIFRATGPIGYLVGLLIGSLVLYLYSFQILFALLGVIMLFGVYFTVGIKDTK